MDLFSDEVRQLFSFGEGEGGSQVAGCTERGRFRLVKSGREMGVGREGKFVGKRLGRIWNLKIR